MGCIYHPCLCDLLRLELKSFSSDEMGQKSFKFINDLTICSLRGEGYNTAAVIVTVTEKRAWRENLTTLADNRKCSFFFGWKTGFTVGIKSEIILPLFSYLPMHASYVY